MWQNCSLAALDRRGCLVQPVTHTETKRAASSGSRCFGLLRFWHFRLCASQGLEGFIAAVSFLLLLLLLCRPLLSSGRTAASRFHAPIALAPARIAKKVSVLLSTPVARPRGHTAPPPCWSEADPGKESLGALPTPPCRSSVKEERWGFSFLLKPHLPPVSFQARLRVPRGRSRHMNFFVSTEAPKHSQGCFPTPGKNAPQANV